MQFWIRAAPTLRAAVTIITTSITNIKPSELQSPRVHENRKINAKTVASKPARSTWNTRVLHSFV